MKKIFIIILLFATILPTFATIWEQVSEKSWIDIDSIEPFIDDYGNAVPNQYSFWVKTLNNGSQGWRSDEKKFNKKIWYMLSKDVIDIKRKTSAMKFFVYYDLNEKCITSEEIPFVFMNWYSIIPNTVGEYEYEIISNYVQKRR